MRDKELECHYILVHWFNSDKKTAIETLENGLKKAEERQQIKLIERIRADLEIMKGIEI